MSDPVSDFWYSKTKNLIQEKSLQANLSQEVKHQLNKHYVDLKPENAKHVFDKIVELDKEHCAQVRHEFNKSILKVTGSMIFAGATIGLLGYLVTKNTQSTSTIHKWASKTQWFGISVASLGFCGVFSIGH
jgi:hypothetical protein